MQEVTNAYVRPCKSVRRNRNMKAWWIGMREDGGSAQCGKESCNIYNKYDAKVRIRGN